MLKKYLSKPRSVVKATSPNQAPQWRRFSYCSLGIPLALALPFIDADKSSHQIGINVVLQPVNATVAARGIHASCMEASRCSGQVGTSILFKTAGHQINARFCLFGAA